MGGNNKGMEQEDKQLQQQIDMQNAQIQEKNQAIISQRIALVKSQGNTSWVDPTFTTLSKPASQPPGSPWFRPWVKGGQ